MKISVIEPRGEFIYGIGSDAVQHLELCGRTCYKSEDSITTGSADRFVKKICRNRHESVLEHASATARIVCSRAASHQLVRHRIGAYSQESQRYVNYARKGYEVICPPSWNVRPGVYDVEQMPGGDLYSETPNVTMLALSFRSYENALKDGRPEDARYFLPNACKTEVVVTYNFRTWRHIFRERALNSHAQWEIRGIMLGLYETLLAEYPAVFDDLQP